MKKISVQLPDMTIDQIEELKQDDMNYLGDSIPPTTTDIVRRAINCYWNLKCRREDLPFN